MSIRPPLRAHHLLQDVIGEEAVLDVGHLHLHGDAVVIGTLLEDGDSSVTPPSTAPGPPPRVPPELHRCRRAPRDLGLLTSGGGITQKGVILDSTPGLP